jgi:hypothetical protein
MLSQRSIAIFLLLVALSAVAPAQDRLKGGIKGRVRVDGGETAAGVSVVVRRGDTEVSRATTNDKGEFEIRGLIPGAYGLTFRKPGLSVGRMENVEVRAGKVKSLSERVFLPVDEGSLALLRGSVFDQSGKSFRGARVELSLIQPDGSLKKLDSRVSNTTGSFGFRLTPTAARYRVTAKADGMEAASEDVEIEGAAIFRVALTLNPSAKK